MWKINAKFFISVSFLARKARYRNHFFFFSVPIFSKSFCFCNVFVWFNRSVLPDFSQIFFSYSWRLELSPAGATVANCHYFAGRFYCSCSTYNNSSVKKADSFQKKPKSVQNTCNQIHQTPLWRELQTHHHLLKRSKNQQQILTKVLKKW